MSIDDATGKKGSGWTDREKLTYLFSTMEHSGTKLDYKAGPIPPGRTLGACKVMIHRLKATLKDDLEALKDGREASASASADREKEKGSAAKTPRKRKAAPAPTEGAKGTKRGRKKKSVEVEEEAEEEVKEEVEEDEADEKVAAMLKREVGEDEDEEEFSA